MSIPSRSRRLAGRLVPLLIGLSLAMLAPAQSAPTGTVSATVDGEERSWFTMRFDAEETGLPTATWSDVMGMFSTFSIQAHPERRYAVEGTLSIEFTDMSGVPADCPCTYDATLTMWTTSSMLEDVYLDDAARVVLTSLEPLGEDAYAVEGTFSARPVFHPSIMEGPVPSDAIDVEGAFAIDPLPRNRTAE